MLAVDSDTKYFLEVWCDCKLQMLFFHTPENAFSNSGEMRLVEGLSQPGTHNYTWFLPLIFRSITYQFLFALEVRKCS